jgi:LPS O-antigen subunit length determinant protein (WzzB/FepE family)
MEKQDAYRSSDTIDLVRLIKVLVKRKWLVILGTLVFTLAALVISLVLPKVYLGEGFIGLSSGIDIDLEEVREIQKKIRDDLQNDLLDNNTLQKNLLLNEALQDSSLTMKTVSIPDYKKYESQFTNPHKFLRFIELMGKTGNENEYAKYLGDLKLDIRTSEDIAQWIEPVYAYSKKDMSDLGQISKDVKNFVVGVRMQAEQHSSQTARTFVWALGNFIKDSILYGKLSDYINIQLNKSHSDAKSYENLVIQDEFKLKQLTQKLNHIQEVLKKYPQSREMVNRELFSVQYSGYRYLSPVAQIVGTESHIADIDENLAQNRRKQQIEELRGEFFTKVKEILESKAFGAPLLRQCMRLKDRFFTKKNLPADIDEKVIRLIANEVAKDLENFRNLNEEMQFLAGPSLPKKPIKPRKVLITAISFILGLFIFVFSAFFIEWWENNKNKI